MKIDTDLRAAIRSAEKCHPFNQDYEAKRAMEAKAIEEFFKRCPAKGKLARKLAENALKAEADERQFRRMLCERFGLRHCDGRFRFADCGGGQGAFIKAGGRLPTKAAARWTFDAVMAELAAAEPKQLKAILKKYNINWQ